MTRTITPTGTTPTTSSPHPSPTRRRSVAARTAVLEVRPGEGGQDAATFAAELDAALRSYATRLGLTVNPQPGDGRTLTSELAGRPAALASLEAFTGTHRIQRMPVNDPHGRRHTSTASVALLDADAPVVVELAEADLLVQTYRGTGPGGQKKNKTSSAVRMRHVPSGLVVTRESGRSLTDNLAAARADLTAQLTVRAASAHGAGRNISRRAQISTAERSAKSFTHNAQRGESLCHETGQRWELRAFLRGRLDH
jgi:peptide chain release factor 1